MDMDAINRYRQAYDPPDISARLKPHEFARLVNELRDVAVKYGHTQQLREHIKKTLRKYDV